MTVNDVLELRRNGRLEEAYDRIRALYAHDKGVFISLAMFWIATDILKKRIGEGRLGEAEKILLALERMQERLPSDNKSVGEEMLRCRNLMDEKLKRAGAQSEKDRHLLLGRWGEDVAANYLKSKGYDIVERDWRSGHRDIDIVALKDYTMVFVEVKTRRSRELVDPVMAVDYKKQKNLLLAMNHYIKYNSVRCQVRFDVITVVGNPDVGTPEIEHIENFQFIRSYR